MKPGERRTLNTQRRTPNEFSYMAGRIWRAPAERSSDGAFGRKHVLGVHEESTTAPRELEAVSPLRFATAFHINFAVNGGARE